MMVVVKNGVEYVDVGELNDSIDYLDYENFVNLEDGACFRHKGSILIKVSREEAFFLGGANIKIFAYERVLPVKILKVESCFKAG